MVKSNTVTLVAQALIFLLPLSCFSKNKDLNLENFGPYHIGALSLSF